MMLAEISNIAIKFQQTSGLSHCIQIRGNDPANSDSVLPLACISDKIVEICGAGGKSLFWYDKITFSNICIFYMIELKTATYCLTVKTI